MHNGNGQSRLFGHQHRRKIPGGVQQEIHEECLTAFLEYCGPVLHRKIYLSYFHLTRPAIADSIKGYGREFSDSSSRSWPKTCTNDDIRETFIGGSFASAKKGACCLQDKARQRHQDYASADASGLPVASHVERDPPY